jgi:hypothetical protein
LDAFRHQLDYQPRRDVGLMRMASE